MQERRKILLINAVQQRRLIMGGVLAGILLVNVLAIASLLFNPRLLQLIEFADTVALAALEGIIVAVIAYLSLILSHRIVGPAYAIARDIRELGGGDLTVRTRLRQGDFHAEVAEAFNLSAETLCGKIKTVRASLTILEQQADTPDAIRQSLRGLLRELDYFKTEPSHQDHVPTATRGRLLMGVDKPSPLIR
jgi:methyl-accepting chemotaxis protein